MLYLFELKFISIFLSYFISFFLIRFSIFDESVIFVSIQTLKHNERNIVKMIVYSNFSSG